MTFLSGFCNPTNPPDSHARCKGSHGDQACVCECHTTVELDTVSGIIVTTAEPEADAWFAARREGITGTDLPKILGLSKYGNALSVWLDKRGELDDTAGEAARWGQILEDPVALEWAERNDTLVEPIGIVANAEEPWIRASLDRRIVHGTCPDGGFDCGLEIKTRSAYKASDWRDGVPDDVLAQTTWGLIATGYDHMHVAALIGGQRLASYRVDRDEKLVDYLLTAARPVWQAVIEGTPPEAHPDSEGVLLDLLDRIYTKRAGDRDLDADKAAPWLEQYAEGLEFERTARKLKTAAKTALVQMLDDGDTGLIDDVPAFTYQRPEPGFTVTAENLRRLRSEAPDLWDALREIEVITTTDPGPRFDIKRPKKGTAS